MNIFVAKLSCDTGADKLRDLFENSGEVHTVKLIMDHETGRSKGIAFVEMPNGDEAYSAISELHESVVDGATIVVSKARGSDNNRGGGGYSDANRFNRTNNNRGGGSNRNDSNRNDYNRGGGY